MKASVLAGLFGILFLSAVVSAAPATSPLSLSANASDLVYTPLPQPCRVIDTRIGGGPLTSERSFRIAGSGSLSSQGGEAAGCGIPAGVGKAAAVMINFVAVTQGRGNLRASAWPNPVPATGSIINYHGRTTANGVVVPVCDYTAADCANGFDITLLPNGARTDLVADVFGYFSKFDALSSAPQFGYTILPEPCRIFDTRLAGGVMAPGTPRNFVVAGATGFAAQGGNAAGCGIPSGANAVAMTIFAGTPDGIGNIKAASYPNAVPTRGSIINYEPFIMNPIVLFANSVIVPLCDASASACSADLTLQANVSKTSLVGDVLGYFAPVRQQQAGIPATEQNLLYTTLPHPCRIVDQRKVNGWLWPFEAKSFKVAGATGFDLQGGVPEGCGVPEDATVAMINFVAVNSQGAGAVKATRYARPIPDQCNTAECQDPTRGTILEQPGPEIVSNAVLLPLCNRAVSTCTNDITLEPWTVFGVGGTAKLQLVADVIGYARAVPAP